MRNHQSTTNPRISLDNTGDLVIEKVTPEDRGRYECLSTEVLPNHETGKERDRPQSNDQMLHIFYVNVINDRSIWPFNGDKKNFSTVIFKICNLLCIVIGATILVLTSLRIDCLP